MAKKIKKHFVFDLDDTLINGRSFCGEAMARTITNFEKDINFEDIITFHDKDRGHTIVELYKNAINEFKLKTSLDKLVEYDGKIQNTEYSKIELFEGVEDVLSFLKNRGNHLHICTNRKSESLIPILKNTGILKYFDNVISCIDAGHKKPEPDCLINLIDRNNVSLDEVIYFGDSLVDSEFAKNAGIDFIIFDQYLNGQNLFKKLIYMFVESEIIENKASKQVKVKAKQ